jgi:hypothetical protein
MCPSEVLEDGLEGGEVLEDRREHGHVVRERVRGREDHGDETLDRRHEDLASSVDRGGDQEAARQRGGCRRRSSRTRER